MLETQTILVLYPQDLVTHVYRARFLNFEKEKRSIPFWPGFQIILHVYITNSIWNFYLANFDILWTWSTGRSSWKVKADSWPSGFWPRHRRHTMIRENRSTVETATSWYLSDVWCIYKKIDSRTYTGYNKREKKNWRKKRGDVVGERKNNFKMWMKENGETLVDP